jgi:hypothetical protein
MLGRSPAKAGQATFEPDDEDEEDDEEDEDDPDEEDEDEDEDEPAFSPAFLSPLSPLPVDLSPDEVEVSAFLLSDDPFADAAAGSELFWDARLSVR